MYNKYFKYIFKKKKNIHLKHDICTMIYNNNIKLYDVKLTISLIHLT